MEFMLKEPRYFRILCYEDTQEKQDAVKEFLEMELSKDRSELTIELVSPNGSVLGTYMFTPKEKIN